MAVLAFSPSFRQHALTADVPTWDKFFLRLSDLHISIELAGDFYCRDWRELLKKALGESMPNIKLDQDDHHGHHHLWSIPLLDKKAKAAQPVASYEVLEKSIYGEGMEFDRDPRIIKDTFPEMEVVDTAEEQCPICLKLECECPSHVWFPCQVELIQTENRGVGVRTLQVSTLRPG